MLAMTGWAMLVNLGDYFSGENWLLFCIGAVTLVLEIWMLVESALILKDTLTNQK
jgi:carbon starvation protein